MSVYECFYGDDVDCDKLCVYECFYEDDDDEVCGDCGLCYTLCDCDDFVGVADPCPVCGWKWCGRHGTYYHMGRWRFVVDVPTGGLL